MRYGTGDIVRFTYSDFVIITRIISFNGINNLSNSDEYDVIVLKCDGERGYKPADYTRTLYAYYKHEKLSRDEYIMEML